VNNNDGEDWFLALSLLWMFLVLVVMAMAIVSAAAHDSLYCLIQLIVVGFLVLLQVGTFFGSVVRIVIVSTI